MVKFLDIPYLVTTSKSAAFMATFGCDGPLVAGDELTIQLAVSADPDAGDGESHIISSQD